MSENQTPAARAHAEGRQFKQESFEFRSGMTVDTASFASADSDGPPKRFRLHALTGKPFLHPWWGNLAIDLSSLSVKEDQKIPILREHDSNKIVGHSDAVSVGARKGIVIEGNFSQVTADGLEVAALSGEGHPWEASVAVPPAELEFLGEGQSTVVNGHKVVGPGTVFRGATLRETSFVSLGADPGTSTSAFGLSDEAALLDAFSLPRSQPAKQKDKPMSDNTPAPADSVTVTAQPDGTTTFNTTPDPVAVERQRQADIQAAMQPGQEALALELISGGKTVHEALAAFNADLQAKLSAATAAPAADPQASAASTVTPAMPVIDSALANFKQDQTGDIGPSADATPSAPSFDPETAEFSADRFRKFWEDHPEHKVHSQFSSCENFLAYFRNAKNQRQKYVLET